MCEDSNLTEPDKTRHFCDVKPTKPDTFLAERYELSDNSLNLTPAYVRMMQCD
jgi:hypothetical protein